MEDEFEIKIEWEITDIAIDRAKQFAMVGIKATEGNTTWAKAYRLDLNVHILWETFKKNVQADLRIDVLRDRNISEILSQDKKPQIYLLSN